jgi:hypothetical protein
MADRSAYYRKYYLDHRERMLANRRAWYASHRAAALAKNRAWADANRAERKLADRLGIFIAKARVLIAQGVHA